MLYYLLKILHYLLLPQPLNTVDTGRPKYTLQTGLVYFAPLLLV